MKRLIVMSLGAVVALALLAPAGGAEAQPAPVRLQLVIHRVHVLDDSDALTWGELTYRFQFQRGPSACGGFWCIDPDKDFRLTETMSATTTQVRGIHKTLGGAQGLVVNPGDQVRVGMAGVEEDWDGPGIAFCPVQPWSASIDTDLCGAHDVLGRVYLIFQASNNWGIGEHSQLVTWGGNETFRVDFQIRSVPATATSGAGLSASPTPRPTPTPRSTPLGPRQHEP
jgi:hypothetical protein